MPLLWLKDTLQTTFNNYKSQSKMKYSFKLKVEDPKVFDLIKVELDGLKSERSTTKLTQTEYGFDIEVEAKDAVALRASLNSIAQLLKIYEKVQEIK